MTKENLIKIIGNNFKPKDVGVGILNCISEKEQIENLANELLEAINYTRCCKSDSELLQKLEKVKNFEWGIDPTDNERRMCELIMLL